MNDVHKILRLFLSLLGRSLICLFLHSLVSQTPVFSFSFVDLMVWLFARGVAKLSEKVGTGE